jgi:hypothetical protein
MIDPLDPDEPGIDDSTRRRRLALKSLETMTPEEIFALAVRAGIYTEDGELTPPYRPEAGPSEHRPTD